MNNFPENENKEIIEETPEIEEFSTVFSNPEQHKEIKQKSGNKKRLKIVIAAVAAIAVLVSGTFAAIKLIPEKEDDTSTPSLQEIEVLNKKEADYKTVTVKNQNGSFKLYSVVTKGEGEDAVDTIDWYLDGYEKDVIDSSSISYVIGNLTEISASREITEKTLADCGLEKPEIKADIVTNDDAEFSVLVGKKSPDNSGVYLKLSTNDKIYLSSSAIDDELNFKALDFANTDAIAGLALGSDYADYTNEGSLVSFDSIVIKSKKFKDTIVIKPNNDETTLSFMPYLITSPQSQTAGEIDDLISLFSGGISVTGAYSFDVSKQSLNKFGLNDPDFAVTVKVKDFSYTYKFKLQSDGNYAVVTSDSKMIKMIAPDTLKYIDYSLTDFYANWVFIESIDKISNLTVNSGGKNYSFDIKKNPDEEDTEIPYIVTCEGKSISCENFQDFYRYCISLSCVDFTTQNISASDEASLTYTYNDGKTSPVKVAFRKVTATKYQFYLNGKVGGKINASEFKLLDKYLQQLLKGETITYN